MKKRILFFINTLCVGGAEKILVDIVNGLDKNLFDVTVQTLYDMGEYRKKLSSHITYKSIWKKWVRPVNYLRAKFLIKLINLKKFYKKNIENNYDLEIAFLEGVPTKILAFSTNPNKYAWVHTDLEKFYISMNKIYSSVDEGVKIYRQYSKIFFVSQATKNGFIKRFGEFNNLYVQYNPIDLKHIEEKAAEGFDWKISQDEFIVVAVGRLSYPKGYDRLLKVHKKLIDEGIQHQLVIIGDGEQFGELKKYIDGNNLNHSVKMLGYQSNPYKYIKNSDLFISSSRIEGYSTVINEAIILGIPIIATDCSGMKEILGESEYGLIAENSEEGIYIALKEMISNQKLRTYYKNKTKEKKKSIQFSEVMNTIENILMA